MATLCLKNAIDKYWRKSAANSIKEDERALLKQNFLQLLNEPVLKVARQLAVIVGKIARYDVPLQWNDLIPKLIQILQETTTNLNQSNINNTNNNNNSQCVIHNRSLMFLHQIMKSLASKRLLNDRRLFEEISINIINLISNLAYAHIEKIIVVNEINVQNEYDCLVYNLDETIILLKILDKLVLNGFKDNVENIELNQLILNLVNSFNQLISKYKMAFFKGSNEASDAASVSSTDDAAKTQLKEKYEYILQLYINILSNYQETYPYNFINFMEACLNLIINICFTFDGKQILFKQLCINLMNLLKSIVMCDKYKPNALTTVKYDQNNEVLKVKHLKANEIRKNFFTFNYIKQILTFIFEEYLILTVEELDLWLNDEEEFLNEDGTCADAWKYSFRACIETLFQAFVHEFNDLVIPIICELLSKFVNVNIIQPTAPNTVQSIQPSGSTTTQFDNINLTIKELITCINTRQNIDYIRYIMLKDVAYNCASISSWDLMQFIDFDTWLMNNLINELKNPNCNLIIKRRVLILISNWVNIKLSTQYRPLIYDLLCNCLDSQQNLVIRLQATLTLKAVLDDVQFERDVYLPYLSYHFGLLCQLLKQVRECDTKIKVLSVLSFIIERVDVYIRPYSVQLADYLPFLWRESEDHNMLRCSIVTAFNHIVKVIKKIFRFSSQLVS